MTRKPELDEYLEQLWYMKEEGKPSLDALKRALDTTFDSNMVNELSSDGLVSINQDAETIALTEEGELQARRLIRAHRLAERLLHDVLGGESEQVACEFEHTVSLELVDSICTLLGHPKTCPHGLPIPEGECCKRSVKTALSFIVPLTDLDPGQSARIAYVNCRSDQQIHRLEGLCIRPGVTVKLHQNYPTYVIECEGQTIALDKEVAVNICVWNNSSGMEQATREENSNEKNNGGWLKRVIRSLFK